MYNRLSALVREAGFYGLFVDLGRKMSIVMKAGLVSERFLLCGGYRRDNHKWHCRFSSFQEYIGIGYERAKDRVKTDSYLKWLCD
jgi:hypothetical protein